MWRLTIQLGGTRLVSHHVSVDGMTARIKQVAINFVCKKGKRMKFKVRYIQV